MKQKILRFVFSKMFFGIGILIGTSLLVIGWIGEKGLPKINLSLWETVAVIGLIIITIALYSTIPRMIRFMSPYYGVPDRFLEDQEEQDKEVKQ